jgi:hypothetical protein
MKFNKRIDSICGRTSERQIHLTVFDLYFEFGARADIGSDNHPLYQINIPAMQGAGHLATVYQALRQRSLFMRALIMQGENFVLFGAKNRNITANLTLNNP